MGWKGSGS
jgi:hypothetical protein